MHDASATVTASDGGSDAVASADSSAPETVQKIEPFEPTATLVFRHLRTGSMPMSLPDDSSTRETWTLTHDDVHARLAVRHEGAGTGRLDGTERSDARWHFTGETTYGGRRATRRDGARSETRFTLQRETTKGDEGPSKNPKAFELVCVDETLKVLDANAVLVAGDACEEGKQRPRWRPADRRPMKVLACRIEPAPSATPPHSPDGPKFAPAPGVEWAFENSDCMAQEGAFRRLAAKR